MVVILPSPSHSWVPNNLFELYGAPQDGLYATVLLDLDITICRHGACLRADKWFFQDHAAQRSPMSLCCSQQARRVVYDSLLRQQHHMSSMHGSDAENDTDFRSFGCLKIMKSTLLAMRPEVVFWQWHRGPRHPPRCLRTSTRPHRVDWLILLAPNYH